jgi:hypothetical protein
MLQLLHWQVVNQNWFLPWQGQQFVLVFMEVGSFTRPQPQRGTLSHLRSGCHRGTTCSARWCQAFYLFLSEYAHEIIREEQKALGLNDFLVRLPDVGKDYYKAVVSLPRTILVEYWITFVLQYFAQFPGFLVECLGPTVRSTLSMF